MRKLEFLNVEPTVLEVVGDELSDRHLGLGVELREELRGELALPGGEVRRDDGAGEQHGEDETGDEVGVRVVRPLDLGRDEEDEEGARGRQEHAG
ncbi:hypothetical protein [Cryobacterium sp. 10C3]|uniref:hypothetical protein n=1 Tax=Cryobacterium sp. 10C3 TaxID=3048577 RepID=UPI002AB32C7D|nr:hypothetical protein [Cryobacterium sp. 10C3]MDY7556975.1 hypothetical protein [Cryobacterium sp. 10C3]